MNDIFNYSADNFKSYLFAQQQEAFILDLSKATVLEVINEYTEIRRATGHKSESGFEKYICYGIDY